MEVSRISYCQNAVCLEYCQLFLIKLSLHLSQLLQKVYLNLYMPDKEIDLTSKVTAGHSDLAVLHVHLATQHPQPSENHKCKKLQNSPSARPPAHP